MTSPKRSSTRHQSLQSVQISLPSFHSHVAKCPSSFDPRSEISSTSSSGNSGVFHNRLSPFDTSYLEKYAVIAMHSRSKRRSLRKHGKQDSTMSVSSSPLSDKSYRRSHFTSYSPSLRRHRSSLTLGAYSNIDSKSSSDSDSDVDSVFSVDSLPDALYAHTILPNFSAPSQSRQAIASLNIKQKPSGSTSHNTRRTSSSGIRKRTPSRRPSNSRDTGKTSTSNESEKDEKDGRDSGGDKEKEKSSKSRQRTAIACNYCRRRKVFIELFTIV